MTEVGESLLERVRTLAPRDLLLLVAAGAAAAPAWLARLQDGVPRVIRRDDVTELDDLAGLAQAELALLVAPPAALLEAGLTQVLARLRDQLAGRVLVTVGGAAADAAVTRHLLSLGYQPLDGLPGSFAFDVGSYNPPREWNTPEHWAHPENFDRYRW